MTTLTFTYQCRACANPHHTTLTASRPTPSEQSIIVRCDHCQVETQLLVRALPVDNRRIDQRLHTEHGTNAGYARHLRRRDTPCSECREAHNTAVRERNRKRRT